MMSWDAYPHRKWAAHPPGFWIGMLLYLGTMAAAGWALRSLPIAGAERVLVGLSPTLPLALMWHAYLRMVRHQDELYRRIQLEAVALAAGATVLSSFTWGFLEMFQVAPHLNPQWAGHMLVFSYGIAAGLLNQRYG